MKLAKITEQNIYAVMALKLKPNQSNFVRDPLFSLAESYYYRDDDTVLLFALEEQDEVVEFLSLITEIKEKTVHIWRIMIGSQYQSKGYGRKALRVIENTSTPLGDTKKLYLITW
ncbi:GNAT family N-acetyltransferase [Facklamia sp. P12950]|uniref:GNAT family N-acetyltransferase n=1 Tax=Facklamia sp. P12950 TaxID=3421951 RepID=UPI003D17CE55